MHLELGILRQEENLRSDSHGNGQGERYVDHHTLFLVGTGRARFNHAAFEVSVPKVALRATQRTNSGKSGHVTAPVDPLTR